MRRFSIRWLIITIPTSYLIFAAVALIVVSGSIAGMFFGGRYAIHRNQEIATDLIDTAKELFSKAQNEKIPHSDLKPVDSLIQRAEDLLKVQEYKNSRKMAAEAVHQLEYLLAASHANPETTVGRYAKIVEMHGLVEILPPNSVDWISAGKGQVLLDGTRVKTQAQSTAKLRFDDDSTIQMKANSLIMIRELLEDENTQIITSSIELGRSDIEASIKEPEKMGSSFILTMPDNQQADIRTEANLAVSVDDKNLSVVKVFMGRVEVMSGEKIIALSSREALILDPRIAEKNNDLKPVAIPLPPRLIYPANVQLMSLSTRNLEPLNFRWTSSQEAEKYRLEIARDYYFYEINLTLETQENKAKVEKLEQGNYYWRVFSVDKSGLSSEPSAFNSFRIVYDDELTSQNKDLTPPKIQIDSITVMGHIVDISGKTEPDCSLFVNESKEDVFDDGSFRVLLEFDRAGFHIIIIEAYDPVGNVATLKREVTIAESSIK